MKIYTKTGDMGTTGLSSGVRVSKDSTAIEAYGSVDEVNAWMGFCAAATKDPELIKLIRKIQNDLHCVCADLATPPGSKNESKIERVAPERARFLEETIDSYDNFLEPLRQFILAGGTELASRLHIARTVTRRAERRVISHSKETKINPEIVIYLNRLSDLLFVAARVANQHENVADIPWDPKA